MPQYMLLIYDDEKMWNRMAEGERNKVFGEYMEFTQSIVKSGQFRAGDPLQPVTTAKTIREKNGKAVITDGPFAETKEQLGGYYLVECKNIEEAIAIGQRIPSVRVGGSIEVRPVMAMPKG